MRALPGSGKTFTTNIIKQEIENSGIPVDIFSSDYFMLNQSGDYEFNKDKLEYSHKICLKGFINSISDNESDDSSCIILDNTNTHPSQFKHYSQVALAFDYKIYIVQIDSALELSKQRGLHNVPDEFYQKNLERMKEPIGKYLGELNIFDNSGNENFVQEIKDFCFKILNKEIEK